MEAQSPRDLKIESRRSRVWYLYLDGHTQEEIAEKEGIDRRTVYRDIQALKKQIEEAPQAVETVYRDAYDKILLTRDSVQERAEKAEKDSDAAKLWKVAADYDRLILERFTSGQSLESIEQEREKMNKQIQGVIDYLIEKLGPEGLNDFEEYWTRRQTLENWK